MTPADIAAIHSVVSTESPISVPHGSKENLLSMAAAAPARTAFGTEMFNTVFEKAACMMQEIIRLHPFSDGNKRAGLLSTCVLLELNNIRISLPADAADVALKVAAEPDKDHI